jgi:hypothetical protein
MKKNKIIICSILVACLLPLIAQATHHEEGEVGKKKKPDPEQVFKKLDSDSSEGISLEEAKASKKGKSLEKRFAKLDKDGSGELDLEEFKASMGKKSKNPKKEKKVKDASVDTKKK